MSKRNLQSKSTGTKKNGKKATAFRRAERSLQRAALDVRTLERTRPLPADLIRQFCDEINENLSWARDHLLDSGAPDEDHEKHVLSSLGHIRLAMNGLFDLRERTSADFGKLPKPVAS